ncbi:MAG: hypothetical protein JWL71_1494 [Acidobacteria bacterium]|nr:hypothetical protein [Acidobacteriota bacterium]
MTKFIAPILAAVCVTTFASTAHASPFAIGCTTDINTLVTTCDAGEGDGHGGSISHYSENLNYQLFVGTVQDGFDAVTGDPVFVPSFDSPHWDTAYIFLLDAAYNPIASQYTGVSDVLAINNGSIWMYSDGYSVGGVSFGDIIDLALNGTLNGLGAATQVYGDPLPGSPSPGPRSVSYNGTSGANQIGLFNEVSTTLTANLCGPFGCSDLLIMHSPADMTGVPVPEPATLMLVGLGGAAAAYRRRRETV